MEPSLNRMASIFALLLATTMLVIAGCTPVGSSDNRPRSAPSVSLPPISGEFDPNQIEPIATAPTPTLPVTVTSADGREVTITDVSRIIAVNLSGTLAEIVFSLGLGGNVVGRDVATTFEGTDDIPVVTNAHDLSAEAILKQNPTVVLADTSIGPAEVLGQLRAAGIPVVTFTEAWTLEDIGPRIQAVAAALGVPDLAVKLADRTSVEIERALRLAPAGGERVRIAFLYIRGTAGVYLLSGDGSGADSMIEAIGAVDVGSAIGVKKFRNLTSEALIEAAPDVILMMTKGLESVGRIDGLLKLPGMAQTPAGKNRRVVDFDDGALLSFGPRTGKVIQALAYRVYASPSPEPSGQ